MVLVYGYVPERRRIISLQMGPALLALANVAVHLGPVSVQHAFEAPACALPPRREGR